MNAPKYLIATAALGAAFGLAACGDNASKEQVAKEAQKVQAGINEGSYVNIGTVAYQVQISRVLNPKLPEDVTYLQGAVGATQPGPDEQWFAVFLRAQNYGENPQPLATKFRVVDTSGRPYDPIELDSTNAFAWAPSAPIGANRIFPNVNSAAGAGPVRQGALLLFKLNDSVYQNRPLILEIYNPATGKLAATVDLDL
jgi:hypothetical protein